MKYKPIGFNWKRLGLPGLERNPNSYPIRVFSSSEYILIGGKNDINTFILIFKFLHLV